MSIENGNILCMASTPSYNPNKIITKPNKEYWNSILENELSPLTFRSIQGLYAPGSTFKMIVAIAGLYHGVIDTNTSHSCNGKIALGDRLYHCWKNNGHGVMNVENAIKESIKLSIPIVAILDTNSNPDGIDFPIPGNDDARRSIDLYCNLLKETINNAKKDLPKEAEPKSEAKKIDIGEKSSKENKNIILN